MIHFSDTEDDARKIVSALTLLEARSAISRLRHGKAITPDHALRALVALDDAVGRMLQQPVTGEVLQTARGLVDRYRLRALDAVQVASAIIASKYLSISRLRVVASDVAILESARQEGFAIWNPEEK